MATVTESRLRERLQRVEALYQGATTPGEREAARRAGQRLLQRIEKMRADDPIARFCRAHLAALGVGVVYYRPPPQFKLPTERALLSVLARWEVGDWSRERVRRWASRIVDRVTMPHDVNDDRACLAEVLLQLAALHHIELGPADIPGIRRFLRDRQWGPWFDLVATAAAR